MRRYSMLDQLRYPRQFLRKAVWTHRAAVPMNPAPTCSPSGHGLSRAQIAGDGDVWEFECVTVIMDVSKRGFVIRLGGCREAQCHRRCFR